MAAAGKTRAVEIFLNFMVMDMNMNILLRDPGKADPNQVGRMNRFWGDDSWKTATYETSRQQTLWGEPALIKVDDSNEEIA